MNAIDCLKQLISFHPNHYAGLLQLGRVLVDQQRAVRAAGDAPHALVLDEISSLYERSASIQKNVSVFY